MANIYLEWQTSDFGISDIAFVGRRPVVLVQVAQSPLMECVLDSGAWTSIFPHGYWKSFESSITWLDTVKPALTVVGGGAWQYRIGCIRAKLVYNDRATDEQLMKARFLLEEPAGTIAVDKSKTKKNELQYPLISLGCDTFLSRQVLLTSEKRDVWVLEGDCKIDEGGMRQLNL